MTRSMDGPVCMSQVSVALDELINDSSRCIHSQSDLQPRSAPPQLLRSQVPHCYHAELLGPVLTGPECPAPPHVAELETLKPQVLRAMWLKVALQCSIVDFSASVTHSAAFTATVAQLANHIARSQSFTARSSCRSLLRVVTPDGGWCSPMQLGIPPDKAGAWTYWAMWRPLES